MKRYIFGLLQSFFVLPAFSQGDVQKNTAPDPNKKVQIVDVSCGKCNFNLKSESCKLAVRIKGKSYFVEGASIDDFGDAHAKAGLCRAVRKAKVQGEIDGDIFKATYFKLIEDKKDKPLEVKL
ncbi:DUF6370 family protein [Ferruginibacter sp.]